MSTETERCIDRFIDCVLDLFERNFGSDYVNTEVWFIGQEFNQTVLQCYDAKMTAKQCFAFICKKFCPDDVNQSIVRSIESDVEFDSFGIVYLTDPVYVDDLGVE